jgi:hypothetical protein
MTEGNDKDNEVTNETVKSKWAGLGCIVLGVIGIIWGGAVGVLGVMTILGGDPWDAWFGYILTCVFMIGLGVLAIMMGLADRRQGPQAG